MSKIWCFSHALPHLLLLSVLAGCQQAPFTPAQLPSQQMASAARKGFQIQTVHAPEPPAPQLEALSQPPAAPDFELRLQTDSAESARIPLEGPFKIIIEAGSEFALLDADATDADQSLRIQVPDNAFDFYLQPEMAAAPPLCQSDPPPTDSLSDQMDQWVLDKISNLNAQGQSHCTVLPPVGQRQNTNCNSTASGIQCSGAVNKTLSAAACPEMAIYAGASNLNHALPQTRLFIATQNNLTLNQSAQGVLSTRGNLNTSLNQGVLEGIFVGGASSNLNLNSGQSHVKGLYALANNASLSANFNNGAIFEGALCTTGQVHANRNGNSQTHYHPAVLSPWVAELPQLSELLCPPRNNFYTQNTPLDCTPSVSGTVQITDTLYGLNQNLTAGSWYRLPERPTAVPADWENTEGQTYVLHFENHGSQALTTRWFAQSSPPQVPATVKVIPAVDCIQAKPNGEYTAFLSYTNLMNGPVSLGGAANQLMPQPSQGQLPTLFEPGQSPVFPNSPVQVDFSGNSLTWQLGARQVSVQADDPALQCPQLVHSPELLIEDVRLTDTNVSILGKAAPGSIEPDYAGKAVALTLTGIFKDAQQAPFPLTDFLFTLAPPLVQQTFVGAEPQARVLLDDSILLEVLSVSETEIQAVLQTEKLPDLYLKGLHKLSVEQEDWYTDALIQVGDPLPPAGSLMPSITSVEILRDTQNRPRHLRLTGQNFMVYPKFSYTTIDGAFGFGYQTEVTADGQFETLVHIPDPDAFEQQSEHAVIMATPFGVAFKTF